MKKILAMLPLMILFGLGSAVAAPPPEDPHVALEPRATSHRTWSDITTGAAVGYCLANHPYQTIHSGRQFTPDGFEIVASPGVVGGVRRNFVYKRTGTNDAGQKNSCKDACAEFGKLYGPSLRGVPLRQEVRSGDTIKTIHSGLGDIASLAMRDRDFYLNTEVVAGIWSRGNTWHESDVAQADFCCCQAIPR